MSATSTNGVDLPQSGDGPHSHGTDTPRFLQAVSHDGCGYLAKEDSVCDKCGRYIKPYYQLERELAEMTRQRNHWWESRRAAIEGGQILKESLEALRSETRRTESAPSATGATDVLLHYWPRIRESLFYGTSKDNALLVEIHDAMRKAQPTETAPIQHRGPSTGGCK